MSAFFDREKKCSMRIVWVGMVVGALTLSFESAIATASCTATPGGGYTCTFQCPCAPSPLGAEICQVPVPSIVKNCRRILGSSGASGRRTYQYHCPHQLKNISCQVEE